MNKLIGILLICFIIAGSFADETDSAKIINVTTSSPDGQEMTTISSSTTSTSSSSTSAATTTTTTTTSPSASTLTSTTSEISSASSTSTSKPDFLLITDANRSPSLWNFSIAIFTISFAFLI